MIKEATYNARKSAMQFAKDSNTSVGKILSAKQGLFTISPKETYFDENGINNNESTSLYKKIRVVNTINFMLK
jgi:hypothetical protein